jgi:hypothetical protein
MLESPSSWSKLVIVGCPNDTSQRIAIAEGICILKQAFCVGTLSSRQ